MNEPCLGTILLICLGIHVFTAVLQTLISFRHYKQLLRGKNSQKYPKWVTIAAGRGFWKFFVRVAKVETYRLLAVEYIIPYDDLYSKEET